MTLRDDLLPVFTNARTLVDGFGLRTSTLTIRKRTWTGGANGIEVRMGTYTDSDLVITPPPRIKEDNGEITADRITPSHSGGGYTVGQLNPTPTLTAGQEVLYIVTGPNGAKEYAIVEVNLRKNFGYELRLVSLDRVVPD